MTTSKGQEPGGPRPATRLRAASPYVLAGVLVGAGALHLLFPGPYIEIVPAALPAPGRLVFVSGVAEIACGLAVLVPRTRRAGGLAAAALFVAVFPANVQMVVDAHGLGRALAALRLPLQIPLVMWAWQVRRTAPEPVRRCGSGPR